MGSCCMAQTCNPVAFITQKDLNPPLLQHGQV